MLSTQPKKQANAEDPDNELIHSSDGLNNNEAVNLNASEKEEDGTAAAANNNNIGSFEQFETDSNYRQEKEMTMKNHYISNKMQGVTMTRATKTTSNINGITGV